MKHLPPGAGNLQRQQATKDALRFWEHLKGPRRIGRRVNLPLENVGTHKIDAVSPSAEDIAFADHGQDIPLELELVNTLAAAAGLSNEELDLLLTYFSSDYYVMTSQVKGLLKRLQQAALDT
jgi:hypothetical protein